jgi:putative thioredoxin
MATSGAHIVEVTERTFEQIVLEESKKRPVIIDFWATWCGPCRTLGPILEQLAEEYAGAFLLAKLDVDANPNISHSARIQSIPTVLAVFGGQAIDQFQGALPRQEVQRFIDGVLARAGVSGPAPSVEAPSDPARAVAHYQRLLEKDPTNGAFLLELGRAFLRLQRLEEARATLERIEANAEQYNDAQASLKVMGLLQAVGEAGGPDAVRARLQTDPSDARAAYLVACADAAMGQPVPALEQLIELVKSAPAEVRADARRAASTVLQASGRDDERIEQLRRRFAQLLF